MELIKPTFSPNDVISIIMGGGAGTRLFPLTKDRSKPAVPLAGKYRLVDIPISLCINSGLKRVFILTQFNSSSLHRHIQQSYRFDEFSNGFVEIMAAQQTPKGAEWYQGTADAVRQNLSHFANHPHDLVLILSGDQLFRMDFRTLIEQHVRSGAEVTVATIPVAREPARSFGIMQINDQKRITRFEEKPKEDAVLDTLRLDEHAMQQLGISGGGDQFLASMGIYVFNREVLKQALSGTETDFGKDIIPALIRSRNVFAYTYQGYWEDIGTIRAFYDANLDLCEPIPKFNFYEPSSPIYTHARNLPASKVTRSGINHAVVADGCIIMDSHIERSVIGVRARIQGGSTVVRSIIMGSDFYEAESVAIEKEQQGIPRMGIGRNCYIEGCIVDKNARIGDNVRISPHDKGENMDGDNFFVRDGVIVIPKGAVIAHGTVI